MSKYTIYIHKYNHFRASGDLQESDSRYPDHLKQKTKQTHTKIQMHILYIVLFKLPESRYRF
jgi:hypothetical protein